MGKCLVTKLTGVVNNNDLERLGQFKMTITKGGNPNYGVYIYTSKNNAAEAYIEGKGNFIWKDSNQDAGKTANLNGAIILSIPEGDAAYDVYVKDIYYINNIANLSYGTKFDVAVLAKCKYLESLSLQSTKVYGHLSDIKDCPLRTLNIVEAKSLNSTLEELGVFTSLETIYVGGNAGVSGSVEGLIQNFIKNGRTTGNITFNNCKGSYVIYYNNKTFNKNDEIRDITIFSWDASANITVSYPN